MEPGWFLWPNDRWRYGAPFSTEKPSKKAKNRERERGKRGKKEDERTGVVEIVRGEGSERAKKREARKILGR